MATPHKTYNYVWVLEHKHPKRLNGGLYYPLNVFLTIKEAREMRDEFYEPVWRRADGYTYRITKYRRTEERA